MWKRDTRIVDLKGRVAGKHKILSTVKLVYCDLCTVQKMFPFQRQIHNPSCDFPRNPRQWLHQCELHRWLQEAECVHRHPGVPARDVWWILEDDLGAEERHYCHDDKTGRKIQGENHSCLQIWTCVVSAACVRVENIRNNTITMINIYMNFYSQSLTNLQSLFISVWIFFARFLGAEEAENTPRSVMKASCENQPPTPLWCLTFGVDNVLLS